MLRLNSVSKSYLVDGKRLYTVRGVSLHVRAGELVALSGSRSSGVSTLLGLLAGWEEPDAGEIRLGGKPLNASFAMADRPAFGGGVAALRRRDGEWLLVEAGRGARAEIAQAGVPQMIVAEFPVESEGAVDTAAFVRLLQRFVASGTVVLCAVSPEMPAEWASRRIELRYGTLAYDTGTDVSISISLGTEHDVHKRRIGWSGLAALLRPVPERGIKNKAKGS